MTTPELQAAVERLKLSVTSEHWSDRPWTDDIQTILTALEASQQGIQEAGALITDLTAQMNRDEKVILELQKKLDAAKESAHYATGVADLAMKHRDAAEKEQQALREALEKFDLARKNCPRIEGCCGFDAAQQELVELRRDKEIVDWMERARPNVLCLCEFGEGELVTGYLWEINDLHEAKTFREAANAAIQKATR